MPIRDCTFDDNTRVFKTKFDRVCQNMEQAFLQYFLVEDYLRWRVRQIFVADYQCNLLESHLHLERFTEFSQKVFDCYLNWVCFENEIVLLRSHKTQL